MHTDKRTYLDKDKGGAKEENKSKDTFQNSLFVCLNRRNEKGDGACEVVILYVIAMYALSFQDTFCFYKRNV